MCGSHSPRTASSGCRTGSARGRLCGIEGLCMRIAVVANTAWYLCNFRLNLMLELRAAGHAVVAIAPHDETAGRLQSEGIEFESVSISGSGLNPFIEMASVLRLVAAFRGRQVDLVLSYTPKGNLYSGLGCMALRLPFVPNVSGLGRAFTRRSIAAIVARHLYRLTFRCACRVFLQNGEDMAAFVQTGLVEACRAERLPGSGVDLQRFACPASPVRDGAQSSRANATVFLLVARMLWDKGIGEFVEAARRIRRTGVDARF